MKGMRVKFNIGVYPPLRVKVKETLSRVSAHVVVPALVAFSLLATSCVYDHYDTASPDSAAVAVELNIVTRAISSDSYTYEVGSTWENYIDIAGGDYKIYFFNNDKTDATATDDSERNTLIAEFVPREMTAVEGSTYTQYTLTGNVGDDIAAYSDFKVVVLANWGTYPNVTAGTTTIDALVEGDNTTFSAENFLTTDGVSSAHLIPFYGVREYSGVEWKEGWRTTLEGEITLLRALAKVEVVMSEDSDIDSFDSVSIVRYNDEGYCAPSGVYLKADYDHDHIWERDFTSSPHLVGGSNSGVAGERRTHVFNQQSGADTDIWTIYLPEYDNLTDSDYSFIQVTVDGTEYEIYFANYEDGEAANTADYDILRNCLYRFRITAGAEGYFRVYVDKWEERFDNDYTF